MGGEINANLMLNIQLAQSEVSTTDSKTTATRKTSIESKTAMSVKKERRRSVILQCAVSGQSDVDIVWKKEGEEQAQIVELTEEQVKLSLQAQDEQAEKKA